MTPLLTRREFLKGTLTALGAALASCRGPDRLVDLAPAPAEKSTTATPQPQRSLEAPPSPTTTSPPDGAWHEARFYNRLADSWIQCRVCFRNCTVAEEERGFCRNKVNHNGRYFSLVYGHPSALQIDPVEKEPHFHMRPGSRIFCTGTAGCNNRCKFCQNWHLSQRSFEEIRHANLSPEGTVAKALEAGCHAVSFTYNEPTVFYEHMYDVASVARAAGMGTLFHTNGSMNEEPLAALLEHMDAVTVDLKAFTPEFYREVSASELRPVLRTLEQVHQSDAHLEIVNLMVPTLNDDPQDVRRMCRWIRETLSEEVPLHFTRFFPAYKLTALPPTPIETLEQAARIADEEGLQYVYIGNLPGHRRNSTFCPQCGEKIIVRVHFSVLTLEVEKGACAFCGHRIPGIWWDI